MRTVDKPLKATNGSRPSVEARPCRFCAIAAGRGSRWSDCVLTETQSYVVIASIGALVPGWAMVVPRTHALNLSDAYSDPEFTELRLRTSAVLAHAYPSTTIRLFEHGAQTGTSPVGCGVDHAHLHLVPLKQSLVPGLSHQADAADWRSLPLSSVTKAVGEREYLLYSDDATGDDPSCWLSLPTNPVSQYFRRLIAAVSDRPEHYDYRAHPFFDNVAATQATLTAATLAIASPSERPREKRPLVV